MKTISSSATTFTHDKKGYKLSLIKNLIVLFSLLIIGADNANAQSANTNQLGLRLGGYSGITFTHVGSRNVGFELNLLTDGPGPGWWLFSADVEKHIPVGKGFVIYLGGGAYLASHNNYFRRRNDYIVARTGIGLEGVVGVSYYIKNTPLNVGLDIRPRFSGWYDYSIPWDGGLSIRYVFGKNL